MSETVTFLQDEFEKGTSGEKVQGITIIVDGAVKQVKIIPPLCEMHFLEG